MQCNDTVKKIIINLLNSLDTIPGGVLDKIRKGYGQNKDRFYECKGIPFEIYIPINKLNIVPHIVRKLNR